MTSRERILAAIEHREPDKVPVDLGSTPSSGISAIAYNRLKAYLRLDPGPTRVYDVVQQLAEPDMELLDRFGIDVLDVGRTFNTADGDWRDTTLTDGSSALYPQWFEPEPKTGGEWIARSADGTPIAKMPATGTFFDQTYFPYVDGYPASYASLDEEMGKVLWAAFAVCPWDHIDDEGFWETLRSNALLLRQTTDKALMIGVGCNLFEWGAFLRRMDNFLMDLVIDQSNVERLLDALMERHLAFLEKVCVAVGDVVDICRFGDDLGMENGPLMSPESYRRLFKPRHQELCDYVKRNSSMHTYLHSCGCIHMLIPDLVDAGFEVLNPVQTTCREMEPQRLKKEFGREVTFWGGGCDTRTVLNTATPDEVKKHVTERLEIFSPGGGFVFNTVHNILPDVPPQNIVAMYETIDSFRSR